MATKTPYKDLPDLERLKKQWRKLSGLHTREEWSAAIIRAATAAEIAANFAIRRELAVQSNLSPHFVNSSLRWANGLKGKLERILLPLYGGSDKKARVSSAQLKNALDVNDLRNKIAHEGIFCNEEEAKEAIGKARAFIVAMVCLYERNFELKEKETPSKRTV